MRSLLLILTSASILSASCRKDKTPPRETFPLSFHFINEGDANLKSVVVSTDAIFTNETVDHKGDSISGIEGNGWVFENMTAYDTRILSVKKKGYAGCTGQFKFTVWFRETVFSPVLFNKGYGGQNGVYPVGITKARCYEGPIVTVHSADEGVIKFKWPSDTLKAKEVLYFQ